MTLAEVTAAYEFAGVADAGRLAAAFIARITPPATGIPPCPACLSRAARHVTWIGTLPDGSDNWRCVSCNSKWATPGTEET